RRLEQEGQRFVRRGALERPGSRVLDADAHCLADRRFAGEVDELVGAGATVPAAFAATFDEDVEGAAFETGVDARRDTAFEVLDRVEALLLGRVRDGVGDVAVGNGPGPGRVA